MLRCVSLNNEQKLQTWLTDRFQSKDIAFYYRKIHKLSGLWQEVIDKDGEYIID